MISDLGIDGRFSLSVALACFPTNFCGLFYIFPSSHLLCCDFVRDGEGRLPEHRGHMPEPLLDRGSMVRLKTCDVTRHLRSLGRDRRWDGLGRRSVENGLAVKLEIKASVALCLRRCAHFTAHQCT
jgi:hypothetical protein